MTFPNPTVIPPQSHPHSSTSKSPPSEHIQTNLSPFRSHKTAPNKRTNMRAHAQNTALTRAPCHPFGLWSAASHLPSCSQVAHRPAVSSQVVLSEVCKLWSMTNPFNLEFFMKSVMVRDKPKEMDLVKKLELAIEQISRCGAKDGKGPEQMFASDSVESFEFMLGRNRKRLAGEQAARACRSEDAGSESSSPASGGARVRRKFAPIRAAYNWQQHEFGSEGGMQMKERMKTPFELSSVTGVWVKDVESSDKIDADCTFSTRKWAKQIARMNASAIKMDVGLDYFVHSYRTYGLFHSSEKFFWQGNDCSSTSQTCDHNTDIKLTSTGWTKRITWPDCPDHELKEIYRISLDGQTLIAITTLQAAGASLIRRIVYKRQQGGWFSR